MADKVMCMTKSRPYGFPVLQVEFVEGLDLKWSNKGSEDVFKHDSTQPWAGLPGS